MTTRVSARKPLNEEQLPGSFLLDKFELVEKLASFAVGRRVKPEDDGEGGAIRPRREGASSPLAQIRDRPGDVGIIYELESAFAAVLTLLGKTGIFRIIDERLH